MAHISTFIDKPAFSLGPRIVGRANIALSAIGSAEMGTFSLAKAVGTVSNIDVGTGVFSYGSAGTLAGRRVRAGDMFGNYGSFGTAASRAVRTSLVQGVLGSFTNAVRAPTVRGDSGSFGQLRGFGSVIGRHGSFAGTFTTHYMVIRGVGSIGTITGASIRGRYGSFLGSVVTKYGKLASGSFSGTVNSPLVRGDRGSFRGTLSAVLLRASRGSFTSVTIKSGTLPAGQILSGTIPGARIYRYFGSRISGSIAVDTTARRYAVFPQPFANANYAVSIATQDSVSNDTNIGEKMAGIVTKRAGSLQFYVHNLGGPDKQVGSVHITAFSP